MRFYEYIQFDLCNCKVNLATKLVILPQRHRKIQKWPFDYWVPAFAGVTERWSFIGLFN